MAKKSDLDPTKNPALHTPKAPEGYELKGVSTLLDAEGNPTSTWVKTRKLPVAPEDLGKIYKNAAKLLRPLRIQVSPRVHGSEDLLAMYPLGDPHIGMLAWPAESGKAWDLKIAVETHATAVAQLVEHAPRTRHAILANLGDFFHSDGSKNKTTAGTEVDTDGRFPKILEGGSAMLINLIEHLLTKAEIVHVENVRGNHDTDMAVVLAAILRAHFRNEPRVHIAENVAMHTYRMWKKNLFGFTHKPKVNADLPLLMATDRPVAWGQTTHRFWKCGHLHHSVVKEFPGCSIEVYNTLAPQDAWAAGQGYRARQSACCEVYHSEEGRIAKYEVKV